MPRPRDALGSSPPAPPKPSGDARATPAKAEHQRRPDRLLPLGHRACREPGFAPAEACRSRLPGWGDDRAGGTSTRPAADSARREQARRLEPRQIRLPCELTWNDRDGDSRRASRRPGRRGRAAHAGDDRRRPAGARRAYAVAVIVIPPRAFCTSVTLTRSRPSSSAVATSSRIRTARASQKTPSFRNEAR